MTKHPDTPDVPETVERFGMIDEASGYEPIYFGRTTGLAAHGIHGEEYVRHVDYAALTARLAEVEHERQESARAWRDVFDGMHARAMAAEAQRDEARARCAKMAERAGNLATDAIRRMRAAHIDCLDLTKQTETLLRDLANMEKQDAE